MPRSATIIGAIGLVVLTSCGDEPAPAGPSPSTPSPAPAAPVAVRLDGPSSLALGASAQYRVTVSFADGTARDVTNQSTILAGFVRTRVLDVGDGGVVTGSDQGEGTLTAHYPAGIRTDESFVFPLGTLTSSPLRVVVLEPGTFRVSGTVTESGRPFPGVRVTVLTGRRAGLQAPTEDDGTYVLYGLTGTVELGVSEEGLQPQVRAITISDHRVVDFNLQPMPGYDSVNGDWTLTFQASSSCGSQLPPEAATRTFRATLTQRGPVLSVALDAPGRVVFDGYPSEAFGGVSGDSVGFYLQRDPDEGPAPRWVLLEMFQPGRFVGISGPVNGHRTGNTITGTLSGYFSVYRSSGPSYLSPGTVLESSCHRKIGEHPELHSFRLERN